MKYLNHVTETGDDVELGIPKARDYEAWCCSIKCAGDKYQVVLVRKPSAGEKDINCTNCGYALIWKKKEAR